MTNVATPALITALIEQDKEALRRLGMEPPHDPDRATWWHERKGRLQDNLLGYYRALESKP